MPNRRKLLLAAGLSSCALPCVQAARQPKQPHVVVIGAGGAGLAAAAEAARCGALVTVLEKQNAVGGDTLISGGFYPAVDPKRQIHKAFRIQLSASQPIFSKAAAINPILDWHKSWLVARAQCSNSLNL